MLPGKEVLRTVFALRIVKFGLVGAICAAVQLLLLAAFLFALNIETMTGENIANLAAFFLSAQINFQLSDSFTWRDRKASNENVFDALEKMLSFNVMVVGTAVINQATFFVTNLFAPPLLAGVAGIVVAAAANYFVSGKFIFRKPNLGTSERTSDIVTPGVRLSSIAVVLPAYNEAENLPRVVKNIVWFLPDVAEKFAVIVVNDGSRDNSAEVLENIRNDHNEVIAVNHPENRGYGAAIRTGFTEALRTDCEFIFFTDSDGQFDITDLKKLTPLSADFDIVAGYRIARADSMKRIVLGEAWTLLSSFVLGLKVRDMDCAFKLIRRNVFVTIGDLTGEAATINPELLHKAHKAGFTFTQVGVNHFAREAGHQTGANLKVIFMSVVSLLALRFNLAGFQPLNIVNKGEGDVAKS